MDIKVKIASLQSENSSLLGDIDRINADIQQKNQKVDQINADIASNKDLIEKEELKKMEEIKKNADGVNDFKFEALKDIISEEN